LTCPKCRTVVPEQSAFCLACGTRLPTPVAARVGNGAAGAPPAERGAAVPAPAAPVAAAPPPATGRQPYALSFAALVDERLRYRVARWIVERAPAHAIAEVQEDLRRGTFLTFLALTAEEAERAQQGIGALGVPPNLVRLAPATAAELMLPARARPSAPESRTLGFRDWRTIAIAVGSLLLFGLAVVRFFAGRGF
jgi:hypothetical protein